MNSFNNKIRIVFFLPSLGGGGAENNTIKILDNLNRERYQVSLLLGERKGVFLNRISQDVPVFVLASSRFPALLFKISSFLKKEKPDILVSTFPRFNIINILAKKLSQTKTKIVLIEQTIVSELKKTAKNFFSRLAARFILPFLIKTFYPKAKAIICVSRAVAADLGKIMGSSQNLRVVYNPIVGENIYTLSNEPFGHPWFKFREIPIILSAGRLIKTKDYPTLLSAFSLILKKQSCHLVILGEGEERKKLEELSKKLGIAENVTFLGFQKNPYQYMKKASVFILSSLIEGFSNVIVEAMACGSPVISTDVSGPSEILEKGKWGILVPKKNERAMADAVLKILRDSSLRQKLSEGGKKRAQDFSVRESIRGYEKVFKEIL